MLERYDVPLAGLTTLRVGGPARRMVDVDRAADVGPLLRDLDTAAEPVLVLGGGSNLVVPDSGFGGTVVRVGWRGLSTDPAPDGWADVTVQAGEVWDDVVARSVNEGWSGVEALSGIPGLAGATPIQNVGAYGQEIADTARAVLAWDRQAGESVTVAAADCGFGYRTSRFKQQPGRFVVLAVQLRLRRTPSGMPVRYAELAQVLGVEPGATAPASLVRQAVLELRRGKGMVLDPADHDTWSVGSFFTNPVLTAADADRLPPDAPRWPAAEGRVKTSAAWLIQQAGFGTGAGAELTGGRVTLSTKHALAITNRGTGSADDVLRLAAAVAAAVHDRFGITLVPEPVVL